MLDRLRDGARYLGAMRRFLASPLALDEACARIGAQLARRAESFLALLEAAVFARPASPYRRLFEHARTSHADVRRLVGEVGLEGALSRLFDAGVFVTLAEFKGRRPIVRGGGLEIAVRHEDFDNPLLGPAFEARTSGSRGGGGRRVLVDFELLVHEAAHVAVLEAAHGLAGRPVALWRAPPPDASGLKTAFRYAKLGTRIERWFASSRIATGGWRTSAFAHATFAWSRLCGAPIPFPEHTPRERAGPLARWLAGKRAGGRPAVLCTNPSSCVRICVAAREAGLDIAGTSFRLGGEPFTEAKARVVAAAGARAVCQYSMAELGHVGLACAAPAALDDMHLLTDKVAAIERLKTLDAGGATVRALVYTTLLESCPKLMINVESDDMATLEERACGCRLGALGLGLHLSGLRSYEKLTSEGVTFIGSELVRLLEDVLPARFGGHPTDYQLVEEEVGGLTRVSLLASPRVGPIDDRAAIAAIYDALRAHPRGGAEMAEQWRQGGTVRLVRREPYATGSAKILPLHVLESRARP